MVSLLSMLVPSSFSSIKREDLEGLLLLILISFIAVDDSENKKVSKVFRSQVVKKTKIPLKISPALRGTML